MIKKVFPLFAVIFLAACASSSNTLTIDPKIALPQADPSLMGITLNISSADKRSDPILAKVSRDGQLVSLYPSRDMRFLMQEVLDKQMVARGYMTGGGPNATEVHVVINQLYANVQEGNLRYNIDTVADITISAQTRQGNNQSKTYRANYNVQVAFSATNKIIANALNSVLNDIISDMANDTSLHDFIKKNSR
ncbi:MAG: YajG family lipoprotein [Enterobacteriaceae bacterium]